MNCDLQKNQYRCAPCLQGQQRVCHGRKTSVLQHFEALKIDVAYAKERLLLRIANCHFVSG